MNKLYFNTENTSFTLRGSILQNFRCGCKETFKAQELNLDARKRLVVGEQPRSFTCNKLPLPTDYHNHRDVCYVVAPYTNK